MRTKEYLTMLGRSLWEAHREAEDSRSAALRKRVDAQLAEMIGDYYPGATWHGFVDRGIAYRNRYNDSTWLIYDAESQQATSEQLHPAP